MNAIYDDLLDALRRASLVPESGPTRDALWPAIDGLGDELCNAELSLCGQRMLEKIAWSVLEGCDVWFQKYGPERAKLARANDAKLLNAIGKRI